MKKLILGLLALTSVSSYANKDIKLIPGLYVTSAYTCDFNVVQTANEIVLEHTSNLGKNCSDSGRIVRAQKTATNIYSVEESAEVNAVNIDVKGPKNFLAEIVGYRTEFYKLFEAPKFETVKSHIPHTAMKLMQTDISQLYYQGVAGLGRCKIVECVDGSLDIARNDRAICETKLSQTLSKQTPGPEAEKITRALYQASMAYGCGN